MSLLAGVGVVRIDVDGAWYELRRCLGWFALEETGLAANIKISLPASVAEQMQEGRGLADLDPETPVGIAMPGPELTLKRLQARISAWSHDQTLRPENIKQLPPAHVRAILAKVDELEEAENGEVEALEHGAPFESGSDS